MTTTVEHPDVDGPQGAGGTLLMSRMGVELNFREQNPALRLHHPNASVSLAPALLVDVSGASAQGREVRTQFGMSVGAAAEFPLAWEGVTFQAGLEDYMTAMSNTAAEQAIAAEVSSEWLQNQPVSARVSAGSAHLVVLRVGLSYRF
jgi:hypothetical protein